MKKYGALIALGLAIVFGAAAVVLTNQYLSGKSAQPPTIVTQKTESLTKIVVPASDIEIGTPLNSENLALVEWPEKNLPQGSFKDIEELKDRVAVTKLFQGRPIIAAELAGPGSGAGLVALIEPGKRAMAIRVDEVTGVGGFILPNAMVDVIGVDTKGRKQKRAETILKKIKVLARSQETYPDEEGKPKIVRTVTLELKPDEAETLALQTHEGSIYLVLRNPLEEEPPPPKVVKKAKPRRIPTVTSRVTRTAPQPFAVEVIRGTSRDTVKFKNIESDERH